MTLIGPLFFSLLVAFLVLLLFFAVWRLLGARDPVDERLAEYGVDDEQLMDLAATESTSVRRRQSLPLTSRLLAGGGFGNTLSRLLIQADLPLTAAEYTLIMVVGAMIGMVIGFVRGNLTLSLLLAVLFALIPFFYLRSRANRRRSAITEQVPELLTLLTGALRSGFGLSQALEMIVDQLPVPIDREIQRVLRAVSLGLPFPVALSAMSQRVGSDELDMVVTAINIQYETGGNLAQTLDSIGDTIRDRLRIKREIRVLTAQQRATGYILAALPILLGIALFFLNPEYIMRLFEPGWIRILPITALIMMVLGFLVIRKIVDIEV